MFILIIRIIFAPLNYYIMNIEYNQAIEVSEKQYNAVRRDFSGIICYMKKDDKFFIKVWIPKFIPFIEKTLLLNA